MHNNYRTFVRSIGAALGSILAASTALGASLDPGDLVIVKSTDTDLYRYQPGSGIVSVLATVGAYANDVTLGSGIYAGLAWVASQENSRIQKVDLARGEVTPFIQGVRFHATAYHDGKLYATTPFDSSVLVYDAGTGALLNTFNNPLYGEYTGIEYNSVNNRLVLASLHGQRVDALTVSGTFST